MQLAHPEWLWLLTVLPVAAIRSLVGEGRRWRDWRALESSGKPPAAGTLLWLLAALFLIVALARPRWGRGQEPPLPSGRDVVLAVDVSRSMGSQDAVPDRLGIAVEAAESLLRTLGRSSGDRVAVVGFAGRGVKRCPLTEMLGAAIETLHDLKPGGVQPGGTDLGAALDVAREAFDDQDHAGGRIVVLFSDGEDHSDRWREALDRIQAAGIVVHTIVVGDPNAAQSVPGNSGVPLIYKGEPVTSMRSDKVLATIARETGGAFIPLGMTTTDLGALYQSRIEPVAASERGPRFSPEIAERFRVFLLIGLALTLAACLPLRERPYALAGRFAFTMIAALIFTGATLALDPAEMIEAGRTEFAAGREDAALLWFQKAIAAAPGRAIPRYDAAATLYRLGKFEEAALSYRDARELASPALRAKIDFALGNTALARGDLASAIHHYDECIASTSTEAEIDRVRQDAAVNKEYAKKQASQTVANPESQENPDAQKPSDPPSPKEKDKRETRSPAKPSAIPAPGTGGIASGRRGVGGSGGSGKAPPLPGSPEDQLEQAVNEVKKARAGRLPKVEPPQSGDLTKEW